MAIVIKKRVSFDFLGSDYKDAYINFQSIPLKDFDALGSEVQKAQDEGKAGSFILDALKKYFIDGSFPDLPKLVVDDLDGLDQESVIKCFAIFTGQDLDPKVQAQEPSVSPSPSSTEQAQAS